MNIAVTAASGQLGAAIVRELVQTIGAASVVALARTRRTPVASGSRCVRATTTIARTAGSVLTGVDAVLLVSGMDAPDKRIVQHRNVIEAARAAGVAKIVYTSVQGPEEGTAFSPIVQSNRQTEGRQGQRPGLGDRAQWHLHRARRRIHRHVQGQAARSPTARAMASAATRRERNWPSRTPDC